MQWMRWPASLTEILMTETQQEQVFAGIPASGDIAVGHLVVLAPHELGDREAGSPAEEHRTLEAALKTAIETLSGLAAVQDELAGEILEFQIALLEDEDMLEPVFRHIEQGMPSHIAWSQVLDGEIDEYRAGDNEYMSARADDLIDLRDRVLRAIMRSERISNDDAANAILVAENLTPSLFLEQDWQNMAGAAIVSGSPTSHVAILARARDVNLIVGLKADLSRLHAGTEAVLDARDGKLVCHPSPDTLVDARHEIDRFVEQRSAAAELLHQPAATADGESVRVLINVDDPSLLDDISPDICDGVGLTRTEFLFEGGAAPDEDTQLAVYARIIAWAKGKPVTIRTLDAGGDKPIPGVTIDGESNPFLGVRGIRLSLLKPEVLKVQLRALLRAATSGPLKIMVPMVTVPQEMTDVRSIVDEARSELIAEGLGCGAPEIGMMVEVPAAALTAADFAADFYSIGSNDLVQYTMAVSRDNSTLADLADSQNPAVLELISRTVQAGQAKDADVSICGDMASSPDNIGPLLGTGIRTVSVAPAAVGLVKLAIGQCRVTEEADEQAG